MGYPEALKLPKQIEDARRERILELVKITWLSVGLRTFIVGIELTGYFLYDSAVLFMDALATLMDISASVILIVSLKFAAKPPDLNHPFGHGRFEPLMGFQLSLLLVVLGGIMAFQQATEVTRHTNEIPISPWAWMIPFIGTTLLLIVFSLMKRSAKKRNSTALSSEAEHLRADACTSILATIVLLTAYFYPPMSYIFDHLGAFVIAVTMIVLGLRTSKENLGQLMDQRPESKYFQKVKEASLKVKGVFATEKIRIQLYGPNAHVDIDVEVDPKQTVEKAHVISQKVRIEIQKALPEVQDVTVHLEPYYPGDH